MRRSSHTLTLVIAAAIIKLSAMIDIEIKYRKTTMLRLDLNQEKNKKANQIMKAARCSITYCNHKNTNRGIIIAKIE